MDASQKEQLTRAVEKAEASTAAEVVLVVLPRSFHGTAVASVLGAVVAFVALALVLFLEEVELSEPLTLAVVAVVGALGIALGRFLPVRLTARHASLSAAVDEKAHAAFSRYGVYRTSKRSGVLVLVSLAERQARVLFDVGLTEAIPATTREAWRTRFQAVAAQFEVATLCANVVTLGEEAGAFLPRSADDVNELADAPQEQA
jgi:putative membrane protein